MWGWACERSGVTKEEGMRSVGLRLFLGSKVASTGRESAGGVREDVVDAGTYFAHEPEVFSDFERAEE